MPGIVPVDATRAPSATQTAWDWGTAVDATAATNGDFFTIGPVTVYGDAVGGGVRWLGAQAGYGTTHASEWYYEHFGWPIRERRLVWAGEPGTVP